eukprot:TRINITY_DN14069_c0_g1_i1.p1 TRINITY_DN14069_c0_g1~~TRINITY_DN14069_c0_g1_i1.p1  ORF type:complete len:474 (-),score=88.31 TRINITY_DN14069_c0_g1_i1:27-1448(-)
MCIRDRLSKQEIDQKALQDFKKEVEIMSQLNHPNVVLFMGACTQKGKMCIVTEILSKGNLSQMIHNTKIQLPLYRRLQMARDAALGMTWLHQSIPVIVHRDIKPSNFLIDDTLRVKVCDFGLSVVKERGKVLRDKDSIPGTPLWMAPEVLMGKDVDERSDVYSYALVLWEIITCAELFPHHHDYGKFKRAIVIKGERPEVPAKCPAAIKDLLDEAWHKDPASRPTFSQMVDRLNKIIVECCINDEIGRKLWLKNFNGKDEIQWPTFIRKFSSAIGYRYKGDDEIEVLCLKEVLGEASRDFTEPEKRVTLENFGNICAFFGPLSNQKGGPPSILQKVKQLMETKWFFGAISKEDAEARLTRKPPGTYLVRLSTSTAGCFTVSKVTKAGSLAHQRIQHVPGEGFSIRTRKGTLQSAPSALLPDFLKKISKDLSLKSPCPGSPFSALFVAKPVLSGYLLADDDDDGGFDLDDYLPK